ncbi:MAG TPA: hypothetical protein EYH34_06410, partial [Planctomycetes bacterium]|nr:hypothetical protein [Planctomycetota bacterium]
MAASFLAVVTAYWLYSLIAVPLIEPTATKASSPGDWDVFRQAEWEERRQRTEELAVLFPETAWERQNPKILESGQVKLLVRDYTNLGGGRVRIFPCTVIFTPDDPNQPRLARLRRSVILEAPEGAVLQFDRALDLRRARIGRLLGGTLQGEITIRSQGSKPGPEDDLWVKTRDVQMTERRIWTKEPVQFRFGPHEGSGRHLEILLAASEGQLSGAPPSPRIAGLQSAEVRHLERLRLVFDQGLLVPDRPPSLPLAGGVAGLGPSPSAGVGLPEADGPVEVTCHGPLRFLAAQRLITLEDRVSVVQTHPDGSADRLSCQTLSIQLAEPRRGESGRGKEEAEPTGGPLLTGLQPRQLTATGRPVVVDAPGRRLFAQGETLQYDRWSDHILLAGRREVFLRIQGSEIHARHISYRSRGPGRLGEVMAAGPGWLAGRAAAGQERFEARWKKRLQVRPSEGQQVLSLVGQAKLAYGQLGRLKAEEIHFWLTEKPPENGSRGVRIEPDRMLARGNVEISSAQLSGAVGELRVWFEPGREASGSGQPLVPVPREQAGGLAGSPVVPVASLAASEASGALEPIAPRAPSRPGSGPGVPFRLPGLWGEVWRAGGVGAPGPLAAARHYQITAGLLSVGLVMRGGKPELSRLDADGDVLFQATEAGGAERQPIMIRGDHVEVHQAMSPQATAAVRGRQVEFRGQGLTVWSTNINLDRGANRLWMDGPGRMELPVDRDLEGRQLPEPVPLAVTWEERMTFDGRTVRFEQAVVARSGDQEIQTEALEVELKEPVRFNQPQGGQPQPKQLRCLDRVRMVGQTHDAGGLVSRQEAELNNLVVDMVSGRVEAAGP